LRRILFKSLAAEARRLETKDEGEEVVFVIKENAVSIE
jgi:hypothetical protein